MLLNNKHYYNLPPQERKNLWKHYKKVYPNMGYTDMVKHFNGEVENYQFGGRTDYFNSDVKKFVDGGKVTFSTDGEKHVVYKKQSPTGMGKGKEGHIMVNHPTKDKGKWDTIDLTEKANAKTVAQGVAATKKWHKENPMEKYAIGGKTDKYVAERDATSTVKTPAIITNNNAFKEKPYINDDFGKYVIDAAGTIFYPASLVGSAIDFYQGDNVGGVAGLIPFGKGYKFLKNAKTIAAGAGASKSAKKFTSGVNKLMGAHVGTQVYDAKSDLIDPLIKDKKAKGGLIKKYEDGGTDKPKVNSKILSGLVNNIPKNRLEAESREEYKRMHPEIEAANFYNKIQKNIEQTSEIYQSGLKKGQPTGKGALEPSYPEMMLMPGSLPIKAASKLGKAAVFAAEALNPIGGVKNLKPKGLTSSVNNTIRNTNSERIVYDLKNTDDYKRYLRNNTNNQLPPPPSEIKFMPDGTTRTVYNQQPITDYISGSYAPDYVDLRRPINGFQPGTPEWDRLNSLINKNRTQETYSTILRDLPREIHQRFDLRKYKNLNLNELTLKNPSLAEKIKLSLKNVYADVKKTANEANKKLGKSIDDKLYSIPNLEDVIESANKNLQKGMGVAKEKANITLKPFNKSTVDVYIDDVKTGSLELLPTTQTRSLSDILLGKSAQLPPFTKSKIAGLRKAGDFPFSSLSNEVAAQYKTKGISGEINKAISEALKAKKSRLYSGGTGHTNEGYLRYQNLLSKGLVKELQTNIYMYKKNGGLVK